MSIETTFSLLARSWPRSAKNCRTVSALRPTPTQTRRQLEADHLRLLLVEQVSE
jgi:hypothetical protein